MDWHKPLLAGALLLISTGSAFSQEHPTSVELESSFGVSFFDKALSYTAGPTFGIGAGYYLNEFLQVNFDFFYSPTQQKVQAATAQIISDASVSLYNFNLKYIKQRPILWQLKPFIMVGGGGILFRQAATQLDLGGGQSFELQAMNDHRFSFNLGGGFKIPLSRKFQLTLQYRKFFFHLNKAQSDGPDFQTQTAASDYLGLKFTFGI